MSAAVEDISATKKRLKIEIPTEIIEQEFNTSLAKIRQNARIPGFRPGKAPVTLIEKKFGNDIKADIIDRLIPQYYSKAMNEASLVPVSLPKFEGSLEVRKNQPLSFALTIEVRPKIDELQYTGLKVDEIPVQVDEKEIEDAIKGLQEGRAMYDVVEREIKVEDLLVIDYVKLDPVENRELSSAKDQVMNLGNNLVPKGILDTVVGRKKGDVVDITLPSFEGGTEKEEAGSRLRITIKEVKEKKLPLIDDELAKDFGHENLEALREKVREGIQKSKKERAAGQQKEKLLETLIRTHEFEIPESLLEKELETLVLNEKHSRVKPQEQLSGSEEGISTAAEDARLAEEFKPKAIGHVKTGILLDLIAEKEGVSVSEDELKERISLLARHFQATPEAVINLFVTRDGSLDNLRRTIRDEKALDLVLSKAEIIKGA